MENKTENQINSAQGNSKKDFINKNMLPIAIVIAGAIIAIAVISADKNQAPPEKQNVKDSAQQNTATVAELAAAVLPSDGVVLPVTWGDLGAKLTNAGVIDANKFESIYKQRNAFTEEYKNLLYGQNDGQLKINQENAGYLLNLFWALGLAQKNPILDSGEMTDPRYGGAGNFASTGGWTVSKGDAMNHYSKYTFFTLTSEQQALVDKISRGIYRPCCGNSTHFPDCNHGMAMLGLLELMASQGVSEQDMWKAALAVNSYWFPDTYITIAAYMNKKGVEWKDVNPEEMLGVNYSSGQGFRKIASQVTAPSSGSQGGGCGIESSAPQQSGCDIGSPAPQQQQSGCGL